MNVMTKGLAMCLIVCCFAALNECVADTLIPSSGTFKITSISHQYGTNLLYFKTDMASPPNPDSCSVVPGYYAVYDTSADGGNFKVKYPLIMAAYLYSKNVQIMVNGCTGGTTGYPMVTQIWVNN